jgi:hypothetical protein
LTDAQRFNHYPATPLPMVSWIFEGDLHMVAEPLSPSAPPVLARALPRGVLSGPHRKPSVSRSPGPVHALSVAFYPQALPRLPGIGVEPFLDKIVPLKAVASGALVDALVDIGKACAREPFDQLEAALMPVWQGMHDGQALPTMRGWVQSMAMRAAFSRPGASLRRAQR